MDSSSVSKPHLPEDRVAKEMNYEGLKDGLEHSIGILKTFEGVPKDIKVYRDTEGRIAPSAGMVVGLIERLRPDESTFVGRMLKKVTWGAQAASRSWYRVNYQSTRNAIRGIEDEILASLLLTREAMEMTDSPLSHIDLLKLKNHIEQLRLQFVASKTGLENLVKTYEEKGAEEQTKQETIKQAVEHFDHSLEEEIHRCLAQIDSKLAELGVKTEPKPIIEEIIREETPLERTPSPEKEKPASLSEDFSQPVDISKELEAVRPKSEKEQKVAAAQAARAFETLELGGMGMKEILSGLSREGVYCLRCYVVSYWKHRVVKNEPLMSDNDPRVKRLEPLRFNGLTLKEALDQLNAPQLVLLKDRLVRYWFTFGK